MSCTKRPPPYVLGGKWELCTDVQAAGVIPEVVLRHKSGVQVILKHVPRASWLMIEAKLRLNTSFAIDSVLGSEIFTVAFLGQKKDYLLIVLEYKGN